LGSSSFEVSCSAKVRNEVIKLTKGDDYSNGSDLFDRLCSGGGFSDRSLNGLDFLSRGGNGSFSGRHYGKRKIANASCKHDETRRKRQDGKDTNRKDNKLRRERRRAMQRWAQRQQERKKREEEIWFENKFGLSYPYLAPLYAPNKAANLIFQVVYATFCYSFK
jgi:hypothetical protein